MIDAMDMDTFLKTAADALGMPHLPPLKDLSSTLSTGFASTGAAVGALMKDAHSATEVGAVALMNAMQILDLAHGNS